MVSAMTPRYSLPHGRSGYGRVVCQVAKNLQIAGCAADESLRRVVLVRPAEQSSAAICSDFGQLRPDEGGRPRLRGLGITPGFGIDEIRGTLSAQSGQQIFRGQQRHFQTGLRGCASNMRHHGDVVHD